MKLGFSWSLFLAVPLLLQLCLAAPPEAEIASAATVTVYATLTGPPTTSSPSTGTNSPSAPSPSGLFLTNEVWNITFGEPFDISWAGQTGDVNITLYGAVSDFSNNTLLETFQGKAPGRLRSPSLLTTRLAVEPEQYSYTWTPARYPFPFYFLIVWDEVSHYESPAFQVQGFHFAPTYTNRDTGVRKDVSFPLYWSGNYGPVTISLFGRGPSDQDIPLDSAHFVQDIIGKSHTLFLPFHKHSHSPTSF